MQETKAISSAYNILSPTAASAQEFSTSLAYCDIFVACLNVVEIR